MTPKILPRSQQDSAWKDILEVYFQEFMQFFYPALAVEIDWSAGYTVLDKELQAITTDALVGKRLVDKLIQVQSLQGEERWVLIHLEVQGNPEADFERRVFEYYYRLYDRYRKPIITIVLLTDDNPAWRPQHYSARVWGAEVITFRFFSIKLLDYVKQVEQLEATTNPFGTVVLAQLAAWETRQQMQDRFVQKFALTRRLYDRGLDREAILNLYKFIDWILTLPEDLAIRYNDSIHQLEEERAVSYITTAERISMEKGKAEGKAEGKQEAQTFIALNLLRQGIALEVISQATELTLPELQALQVKAVESAH